MQTQPETAALTAPQAVDADPPLSIYELLEGGARRDPERLAVLAPGAPAATYRDLLAAMKTAVSELNAIGIGRNDRVAIVLPNGPEMARAFLSVVAAAACAPLNPAYRQAEFEFFLSDLKPKAVLVEEGRPSPVIDVARALGIPLIGLVRQPGEAGAFTLRHDLPAARAAHGGPAQPEDVALLLHTSGTTSRPKLVPLTNANLCHSARNIGQALALTQSDRCLNVMPLFHIHGLAAAVLSSLAAGASVVCSPGFLAPRFFEWLEEFSPTWYTAVPTMHQAILARAHSHEETIARHPLRLIRSCSSALPPQVMAELEKILRAPVIEAYGMTEAAHQMASNPLPPFARKPGSVGKPAGPALAIMDESGRLLSARETGEIVIRGPNVTPGYDSNPAANQAAYQDGWFRTGDRGFFDEDGYLFLTGRTKEMINRGGEKISPREIDEVLMDHPAVAQALAFAVPDPKLGEEVGAVVVLRAQAAASDLELREFAAARLADFKVPRRIVFLDDIPKGPTGKPQRIGLAEKLGITPVPGEAAPGERVEPRTPREAAMFDLWAQVLGTREFGVTDNFLHAGGDSILAAQLLARVAESTGREMPMLVFIAAPTVESMARWLDSGPAQAESTATPLVRHSAGAEAPLSSAQERIWFLTQLEGASAPYIRAAAFRVRAALDARGVRYALNRIVERHEALRTTFHSRHGVPVQVVSPVRPVPLEMEDFSEAAGQERMERVRKMAAQEAHRPFDLQRDLMLRATLVRLAPEDYCLVLAMHHIASDGWSTRVFLREFAAFYEEFASSRAPELPELRIQYADYAHWQRSGLESPAAAERLAWWTRRFDGAPPLLPLPADRRRPARQTYAGARESLAIAPELTAALRSLSRDEKATLFMTLLAAFQAVLSRYTGSEDICVGCPGANRTRIETEPLIGLFVNTLAMRTDLSGAPSFREALARVRDAALGAYAYQDVPFEKIVEALHPARSLSHSPLFQVMFQLRNLPFEPVRAGGAEIEPVEFDPGFVPFDLALDIAEEGGGLRCVLDYSTDLFDGWRMRRMLEHFRNLLEAAVNQPGACVTEMPLLSEEERRQVLVEWNDTARPYPDKRCVHELFETLAGERPGETALICAAGRITRGELNRRANVLARKLRAAGVGPETPVGVCLERSARSAVAMLAVLKAGGAFVPLDPRHPGERLQFIIDDAAIPVIVTERASRDRLPARLPRVLELDAADGETASESAVDLPCNTSLDRAAYIIYTSGSTGNPKGVPGLHRGLLNRLQWMWAAYPYTAGEVCCHKTTLSFVDSIAELFGPLAGGVPVFVMQDEEVRGSTHEMVRLLEKHAITRIVLVPSQLNAILDAMQSLKTALPGLKYWVTSGETITAELARRFRRAAPRGVLINLYGSSEVSADVTCYEVSANPRLETVPIGRPIDNTQVYVLDPHMQPAPAGVPGELYVGGAGLARGYLNLPELTARRFVPNPFAAPGERLFRTGDLARFLPDGNLEFLGRTDGQVKIRGCRVEIAEVESALRRHPAVESAAVTLREPRADGGRLAAYIVCHPGAGVGETALRAFVGGILPDYMIPSDFVFLPELPLLTSGKVDRSALPEPARAVRNDGAAGQPRDDFERRLCAIWEGLLHTKAGVHDNFFDLGGHSLLAARMAADIEDAFGTVVKLATLFEAPTIAQLAAVIRGETKPTYPAGIMAIQPEGSRPPLVFIGGGSFLWPLAQRLGPDQPLFGLTLDESDVARFTEPYALEAIAEDLMQRLRAFQPAGPFYLAGYSLQGLFAYEVARRLREKGHDVALLALFDTVLPVAVRRRLPAGKRAWAHVVSLGRQLSGLRFEEAVTHLGGLAEIVRSNAAPTERPGAMPQTAAACPPDLRQMFRLSASRYAPPRYDGLLVFFEAASQSAGLEAGSRLGWNAVAGHEVRVHTVPGDHFTALEEPNLAVLAPALQSYLGRTISSGAGGLS